MRRGSSREAHDGLANASQRGKRQADRDDHPDPDGPRTAQLNLGPAGGRSITLRGADERVEFVKIDRLGQMVLKS